MITARYISSACVLVALALVPTIIHSYAGLVVEDGRSTSSIPMSLAGFTATPSTRDAGWGKRRFDSDDWIERQYLSGRDDVLLTVLRSYDLKRLYHHPELDIAYGTGYLSEDVVELTAAPGVPVRLLRTSAETNGTAMYALHYDDAFVENPLWFQVRVAGELLFSGRRAMTLFFARDGRSQQGTDINTYASARVLAAAIREFTQPSSQGR